MKLLQWNIWYKEKIENIAQTIKTIDPDIVCLQELGVYSVANPDAHTAHKLQSLLGLNMYYKDAQKWEGAHSEQGNAILSKYPIIRSDYEYIQVSTESIDYSKEGRVYVEVSLQIDKKIIAIGTTHMSYTHQFQETHEKKKETDNLVNVLKTKKASFIFTGDLNTTPESYTIKEIEKYLTNAGPSFQKNTWTTKPFDYQGFTESKLNWRLDYVFHSPDLRALSAEVIQTNYSDHLPLLVEFA
ncbi:hypothetical protein HGB07_07440 [Candidatus Roizmanbacteria bacterium]|nr:hypothetical protein [Candidatus Roizmanbacteria bacterium]